VDAGRDGMDIPGVGVFVVVVVVVRKSAFRSVLESVARIALRSEEADFGRSVAGALEGDGGEAVSALVVLGAVAAVVDLGWRDEGRVIIDDASSLLFSELVEGAGADVRFLCCTAEEVVADFRFSVLPRGCVWGASSCSCCF
jgi:hypothetical protein